MSLEHRRSQPRQPLRHRRILQVRSGNFVAEIQQHLGNPAHADATDAHEMDALNLGKHKSTSCHGFHGLTLNIERNKTQKVYPSKSVAQLSSIPATRAAIAAISRAALGCSRLRAAALIRSKRAGSPSSAAIVSASQTPS